MDLGDIPAPASTRSSTRGAHPHIKAPTSLPVPQLSPLSLSLLLAPRLCCTALCSQVYNETKYRQASLYKLWFNVPPPRYLKVATFGRRSEYRHRPPSLLTQFTKSSLLLFSSLDHFFTLTFQICEKAKSKPRKIFDAVNKLWKSDVEVW